mgnify:CR=1 FL=1
MVKVCHVTSVHSSRDVRIFYKMCTSLANNGYDVYHVAPGENREENGVKVVGIGEIPTSRRQRMGAFAKKAYMAALNIDADIYHLHDPELLPYAVKLKKAGKIVIFDSHEEYIGLIAEKEWIPKIFRKLASKLYAFYLNKVYKKLNLVISASPHIADQIEKFKTTSPVIANYPIIENIEYIQPSFEKKQMIFTGGISPQWCHSEIIQAISNTEDINYVLCGKGSKTYIGWEKVDYRGMLPFGYIPKILAESYLGVALLRYSGNTAGKTGTLGNTKLFEYMLAGLPVICTDFILWKNIINTYECGICVEPTDTNAISLAIHEMFSNQEKAKRMGENGRKAVLEKYNWNIEEQKLLSLYKQLIDERI